MTTMIPQKQLSDKQVKEIAARRFGSRINRDFARKHGLAWPLAKGWKRFLVEKMEGLEPTPPKAKHKAQSSSFYQTWEWKKLRYAALMKHGHRCMCCGWTLASGRPDVLVVDHIKAVKLRPDLALDIDNLQVLCGDCNMGKSQRDDDFR